MSIIVQRSRVFESSPSGAAMIVPTVVAPAYVGPGDVVASAIGFWGLRAYTNASIGGNLFTIQRSSDSTSKTFVSIAGGGFNTADAFFDGSVTYSISTLYDQSGNGHDMTQTGGNRPVLLLTGGPSSNPTIKFAVASNQSLDTGAVTIGQNQPLTMVSAAKNTAATQAALVSGASNGSVQWGFALSGAANQMYDFAGSSTPTAVCADSTFNAIMAILSDGASASALVVDGLSTSGSLGSTSGFGASNGISFGGSGSGVRFDGSACELGIWASTFSGAQITSMNSNVRSYWGI